MNNLKSLAKSLLKIAIFGPDKAYEMAQRDEIIKELRDSKYINKR